MTSPIRGLVAGRMLVLTDMSRDEPAAAKVVDLTEREPAHN